MCPHYLHHYLSTASSKQSKKAICASSNVTCTFTISFTSIGNLEKYLLRIQCVFCTLYLVNVTLGFFLSQLSNTVTNVTV